jgi:hypothetical protein
MSRPVCGIGPPSVSPFPCSLAAKLLIPLPWLTDNSNAATGSDGRCSALAALHVRPGADCYCVLLLPVCERNQATAPFPRRLTATQPSPGSLSKTAIWPGMKPATGALGTHQARSVVFSAVSCTHSGVRSSMSFVTAISRPTTHESMVQLPGIFRGSWALLLRRSSSSLRYTVRHVMGRGLPQSPESERRTRTDVHSTCCPVAQFPRPYPAITPAHDCDGVRGRCC